MLFHATSVAIDRQAVLLTGASGIGKSDLALRLIDGGASLVADDQTELLLRDGKLCASPPRTLAGLIELRHQGLMRLPYDENVPVVLSVTLMADEHDRDRLPDAATAAYLGCSIPHITLPSFAASTPARIRLIIRHGLIDLGQPVDKTATPTAL